MIGEVPLWRQILRQNFTQWDRLADFLELDASQRESIIKRAKFPLNLPLRLAQKIVKGDLEDPILKQFLPTTQELVRVEGFVTDPVDDNKARKSARMLHKYEGRALLLCTSACAMHCRYCFRQNFDYPTKENDWSEEFDAIEKDPSIKEIILSGGDPLSLSDHQLQSIMDGLTPIPHIKRIRFHTRFSIGIPERISDDFLAIIATIPQQVWFVIHANHPRELDDEVLSHLRSIQKLGAIVLNQSVLLKGVNDDVETLLQLSETLVNHGIIPYYLNQLDRVQGAAHFEVPETTGLQLMSELSQRLPGYAVPKYIREVPGEPHKVVLT